MSTKKFCPYCMTPIQEGEPCPVCGLTEGSYSPAPHHLPPGTILMDRYLIGRVLGEGGFGITYIGCDLRLEMKVAVKEYFPTERVTRNSAVSMEVSSFTSISAEAYRHSKEKFLREARAMARMVKQPEIVGVRDFFEANSTAYIVMEYIEGTTLKALVGQRGGRIPAGELLPMMEPIFGALTVMHDTGLLHRDISPDNLMLENGMIRLLDFGCARDNTAGLETLTISLKYGYAPVEQYQSRGQGPWTDVYALAATFYFCLTGRRPPQSMDRLVDDNLVPPRKLGVDLTEQQESALLYGMGIHPRKRFRSMEEFHAALYEGVDWTKKTEGGNGKSGNGNPIGTDSGNQEKKDSNSAAAEVHNTGAEENGSGKTENTLDGDSRGTSLDENLKKSEQEKTEYGHERSKLEQGKFEFEQEKPAWRAWLSGHRVAVGAGAAAAAAVILIGVSTNIATKQNPAPSTETTTENVAKAVTEPATEPVTEAATEPVTEAATEPVTEAATEPVTEAVTGSATEAAEPTTETVTKPVTEAEAAQATEDGTDAEAVSAAGTDTQNTRAVSAAAYTLDSDAAAERRQELEALFANAQTFSGDNNNWEGIKTMMEDDSVSAIIIPSGTVVTTFEAITVTKPVLVETNAYLGSWNAMTIDGENACVYVKGELGLPGVTRTVNGGCIVMDGDSSQVDSGGVVWLENNADLEILSGNLVLDKEQLKVLNLNDTFANSQEVSTAEEFKAALNNYAVDSITVTGDITVDAEGEDHLYIPVPVRVNEGASLSVIGASSEALGDGNYVYLDQEAILVNYGTLNAYLNCNSPLLYNCGSWNGGIFAFYSEGSNLLLLNQGEMILSDDSYNTLDGNSSFINEGTLTAGDGMHLNLAGNLFLNRGTVTVTGENTQFDIREGIIATNLGEIHMESGTRVNNYTCFDNSGDVYVEGGEFLNEGAITLRGTLSQQSGQVRNTGLILVTADDNGSGVLELTERPGGTIENRPAEGTDGCVTVTNGEELQNAMNDDSVQSIIIKGTTTSIDGDFTVTKPVIGNLQVSGTLTVSNGFLAQYGYSGPITAGDIVLESGTFLFQQSDLSANSLTVGEGAVYYRGGTWYSECEYPWGQTYLGTNLNRIEIANGGQMCNLSRLTLNGTEIQIQTGGELLSRGPLNLNSCQVNIAAEGYLLLGGGFRISEDTTVVNDGWLETGYINDFKEGLMAGTLTNNGAMYAKMQLTGVVENNGRFYQDENKVEIQGSGEIRGNATEIFHEENGDWKTQD